MMGEARRQNTGDRRQQTGEKREYWITGMMECWNSGIMIKGRRPQWNRETTAPVE
jgi:hypothetical protein